MNDYSHKGGIRVSARNYLSNLGLPVEKAHNNGTYLTLGLNKWEHAKVKFEEINGKTTKLFRARIFNVPIQKLHKSPVQLKTGQVLAIPKIVQELCEQILENVETEGIFLKSGSRSKQVKIKSQMDERGHLPTKHLNVIDAAVILKCFLRALPEPLIPYGYHNLFLACCNVENTEEVLLIATLLLPMDHLNLLTYLMQFFNEVTNYSEYNKMSTSQLAVCVANDIIPICNFSRGVLDKTAEITRLLIKESYEIGLITTDMHEKLKRKENAEYSNTGAVLSIFNEMKRLLCFVNIKI